MTTAFENKLNRQVRALKKFLKKVPEEPKYTNYLKANRRYYKKWIKRQF